MHHFDLPADVVQTLDVLAGRELVRKVDRRPGQKEERYVQLLGGGQDEQPVPAPELPIADSDFEARLSRLEAAVEDLRARLEA
jgi:uncharacterized protein YceH (UPF0502 family)